MDSDLDGTADETDTYPQDPTRSRLAAVAGLSAALAETQVALSWSTHPDSASVGGYHIYRRLHGAAEEQRLNAEPLTSTTYVDATAANGSGYLYRVTALDHAGREGEAGTAYPFFVAYNPTPVTGLTAAQQGSAIDLHWGPATVAYYHLWRAEADGAPVRLAEPRTSAYRDETITFARPYRYQAATVAEFTDPFTGQTVALEGPLSAPVSLTPVAPFQFQLDGARPSGATTWELTLTGPGPVTVSGRYSDLALAAEVSARAGSQGVQTLGADGRFQVVLPGDGPLTWTLTVSDPASPSAVVSATLVLVKDTQAPRVHLDELPTRVEGATVTLTGTVSDTESGLAEVYAGVDTSPGQRFGVLRGADGRFSVELPLAVGNNTLTLSAVDRLGNRGEARAGVERAATSAPSVRIDAPADGSTLGAEPIEVSGTVYAREGGGLRVSLGGQTLYPAGSGGAYPYRFAGVPLREGYNRLLVRADTPAGSAEAAVAVQYRPAAAEEEGGGSPPAPPRIALSRPLPGSVTAETALRIAGTVVGAVDIVGLTLAGQPVPLAGGGLERPFDTLYDLSGCNEQTLTLDLTAVDTLGATTHEPLSVTCDRTAPRIDLTSPPLAEPPTRNRVAGQSLSLHGQVQEAHLSGFTRNGAPVSLVPLGDSAYGFSAEVAVGAAAEQTLVLEAWDLAGQRHRREWLLTPAARVGIELIRPRAGSTLVTGAEGARVAVVARLSGLTGTEHLSAYLEGEAPIALSLDADVASGELTTARTTGPQRLHVAAHDGEGLLVGAASVPFTLQSGDPPAELAVTATDPPDGAIDLDPATPLQVQFNRSIDPAALQILVRQSVHGRDYDLSNQAGAGFTQLPAPVPMEVHQDMAPVEGHLTHTPGQQAAAFYPSDRYRYGAQLYVEVRHGEQTLTRYRLQVKAAPTLVAGLLTDHLGSAMGGVPVALEEAGVTTRTDVNGNFLFRFEKAQSLRQNARYTLHLNPGQADSRFGTHRHFASVQAGALNELGGYRLQRLNPAIAYQSIGSGERTLLASGALELDLSAATVRFASGRTYGAIHAQMLGTGELPHPVSRGALPAWLYALQPAGVAVSGPVALRIDMPALYGSHAYLPPAGTPVALLGFNPQSARIEPVGVGRVEGTAVRAHLASLLALDYLGYALLDATGQAVLERFASGQISSQRQLVGELERLSD